VARPHGTHLLVLVEVEVAARGDDDAVLAHDERAVEHGEGVQRVPHVRVHDVLLVLGVALERVERQLPRLLHHDARVADHEQRPDRAALPALDADADGELDQRVHDAGRRPRPAGQTTRPPPLATVTVRIGSGSRRAARQQADDDVALLVDAARVPLTMAILSFSARQVVLGQRQRGCPLPGRAFSPRQPGRASCARAACPEDLGQRQVADVRR
jgi:hypothetical protein